MRLNWPGFVSADRRVYVDGPAAGCVVDRAVPRPVSRPFDFRLGIGVPLLFMALLLVLDPAAVDFHLANLFYRSGTGFIGRHNFWLEDILHHRAKHVVIAGGAVLIATFLYSLTPRGPRHWRRPLGYLVLAIGLSTGVVTPLKALTQVQCPWSLREYGGAESYTRLLEARPPAFKPGRCWPGGHAATGFSLLALYFVLRDRRPRRARLALAFALGLGGIFALGRIVQGAHFLSHNLWTLLLDWLICVVCYRWVLWGPGQSLSSGHTDRSGA